MKSCFSKRAKGRVFAGIVSVLMACSSVVGGVSAEEINDVYEAVEIEEAAVVANEVTDDEQNDAVDELITDIAAEDANEGISDETVDENVAEISDLAGTDVSADEVVSAAYAYTENGINYNYKDGTNYIAVSYSGTSTSINIPEKTQDGRKVVSIGAGFLGNNATMRERVTSVTIPVSVYEINSEAFKGCTNLTNVTFGSKTERESGFWSSEFSSSSLNKIDISAFEGDVSLKQVVLPERGLSTIGANAFSGCSSLELVKLPKTLISIGNNAFNMCEKLATVYFYGDLKDWTNISYGGNLKGSHPNAYASKVYLYFLTDENWSYNTYTPLEIETITTTDIKGIYNIKEYLFSGFTKLTSVDLSNVTQIGEGAFQNCTALTRVTLSNELSKLGAYAFYNDRSLKSINLGTGLGEIRTGTFKGCSSLDDITIARYVNVIADDAFEGCSNLKLVSVYGNTAADTYFQKFPNIWIKYMDTASSNNYCDDTLVGYSAIYDGRIGLRFYFKKSNPTASDYVTFVVPDENGTREEKIYFSKADVASGMTSTYIFTIYIAPKYASRDIGAVVSGKNKSYWISFRSYSEEALRLSNQYELGASAEKILRALNSYCDACQRHFDVDAGSIKPATLLDELYLVDIDSKYAPVMKDPGFIGMSVCVDDIMTIKLYYEGRRTDINVTVSSPKFYGTISNFVSVEYVGDSYTVVSIKDIKYGVNPSRNTTLSLKDTLRISYASGEDSMYCMSYCYLASVSGNDTLAYMAKAINALDIAGTMEKNDHNVKKLN